MKRLAVALGLGLVALGLGAVGLSALLAACGTSNDTSTDAGDNDGDVDAGAAWLGDAGLTVRTPAARPLHTLCGIASNPGDFPLGDDDASRALRDGYLTAALDLGAGVSIRRDFRWSEIEPARGTFDFSGYDRVVDASTMRGVPLLGNLLYGTTWAAAPGATDEYYPPANSQDFADFASQTVARYKGRVPAWEIWNEPNNGFRFWKPGLSGDPKAYGDLLVAASAAARAADPGAKVLLGGTVFTPQLLEGAMPWLTEAYAAHPNLAQSFDVAGIHTYEFYPPTHDPETGIGLDPPLEAKLQMHAWLLAQHGAADKPMWITELGWPVYDTTDEAKQARLTVRATILAAHGGAEGIYWYTLRDGPHPEAFPPEDAFGLLHHDGSPKPVYSALKSLLARVGERWPVLDAAPMTGLPEDGHAVLFRGASGPGLIAAWTVTTPSASVTVTAAASVFDEMGAPKGDVAAEATASLGPDVTYFELHE